jgi:hypothetical protein
MVSIFEGAFSFLTDVPFVSAAKLTSSQDDTYIVHYFYPGNEAQRRLHGVKLPPDRFRVHPPPDPRLVAWHYKQAVMMRIREYSVRMDSRIQ